MKKEIIFYRTQNNKCPLEEFLNTIPEKDLQKTLWVLRLLEDPDIKILSKKYFKKLVNSDGIWECRIKQSSNIYRIFCFFYENNRLILTHGYSKKSQKTDPGEIARAGKYKKDYIERHGG